MSVANDPIISSYLKFLHAVQAHALLPRTIPHRAGSEKRTRNPNIWGTRYAARRRLSGVREPFYPGLRGLLPCRLDAPPPQRMIIGAEAAPHVDRPKVAM